MKFIVSIKSVVDVMRSLPQEVEVLFDDGHRTFVRVGQVVETGEEIRSVELVVKDERMELISLSNCNLNKGE